MTNLDLKVKRIFADECIYKAPSIVALMDIMYRLSLKTGC